MVAAGYTSDFVLGLINKIQFLEVFSLEIRIIAFSLGLLIVFFGSAIYIETNMGLSPYDAVAIIISEKINRQNWFSMDKNRNRCFMRAWRGINPK
jgi:uncharacterized membrane protein YczE